MAEVKIWPRGQNETGGILLMPMKKNIPKGHPEWSLVKCPILDRNAGDQCQDRSSGRRKCKQPAQSADSK